MNGNVKGWWVALLVAFILLFSTALGAQGYERVRVGVNWGEPNGLEKSRVLTTCTLSDAPLRFWVFFKKEGARLYPVLSVKGKSFPLSVPVERMTFLELVVTLEGAEGGLTKKGLLFGKTRLLGIRGIDGANVYHLLVLKEPLRPGGLPLSLRAKEVPVDSLKGAFWRTYGLAVNYVARTDAKLVELGRIFQVEARYRLPRLLLVAEEWLDIPEKLRTPKKRRSRGLFGGALGRVSREIAGEKEEEKVTSKRIPVYSVDVLLDEVSVEGKFPRGFQVARSLWNDILEGEVIYQATKGTRRVITASVVFSQMEKNRATRNSKNRIVKLDSQSAERVSQCSMLWPSAQREIKDFLKANPDWKVVIPQNPVVFYRNNRPVYAMYAWFQVNPRTGRMVGVLPSGIRGALSDEVAQIEKTLIKKTHERIKGATGGSPVKGYFSTVAGMYVAAAGVLSGVNLTLCDPSIANMSDKEWRRFLSLHALDFCQKFLEENAELYDSYDAQLGFWQGAMVIASGIGGKEAARDCARRALDGVVQKTVDDAKAYLKHKWEKSKEQAREVFFQAVESYDSRLGKAVRDLAEIKQAVDRGQEWVDEKVKAARRFNAAMEEFYNKYWSAER